MLAKSIPHARVYFGDFEFDRETHELYRHGLKIRIRGHPVEILAFLLEHPNEAVSRKSLKERLWPQDTFVDFEHLLNNSINKLRIVLRDHPDAPRFIETLPGIGYRFISAVSNTPLDYSARVNRRRPNPSVASADPPMQEALRIAVLPFREMGDIRDDFAEGLSVQLSVELERACRHISVIPSISSCGYASGNRSIPEIALELCADFVLTGTVWCIPPLLRISLHLIRCSDQCCIWSESYTRPGQDVLAVQDEITREVCRGVRDSLADSSYLRHLMDGRSR